MNREEYAKLSEEEIRIKVARFEGWYDIDPDTLYGFFLVDKDEENEVECEIPDYFHNLNAIHNAVLAQGHLFAVRFYRNLLMVLGHHDHVEVEAVNAKAAQRLEAFVLSME